MVLFLRRAALLELLPKRWIEELVEKGIEQGVF